MLKARIDSLDDVAPELRGHYVATREGGFALAVEGLDDTGALKRAKEHEKAEHDKTKARLKRLLDAQLIAKPPAAAASPREKFFQGQAHRLNNFTPGTPEWQAEIDAILDMPEAKALDAAELAERRKPLEAERANLRSSVERATVEQAARRIATDLANDGGLELLLPHISARIAAEWNGDDCVVVVRDANGNASQEAELISEFREMRPEFAAIVKGASATDKAVHARRVAETLGTSTKPRQYTRAQFDALDAGAKMSAIDSGAQVVDH